MIIKDFDISKLKLEDRQKSELLGNTVLFLLRQKNGLLINTPKQIR